MLRLLKMDINRYTGNWWNPFVVIFLMFFRHPGILFSCMYRLERYLLYESNVFFKIIGYIFYPIYFLITYYILSYHILPETIIDGGLLLHNRDIVMTEKVQIGKYFTCMGQTTIGKNFDTHPEKIVIGNYVRLGVGAKIIASGTLTISPHTTIGANAVVTKSIIQPGVYVGIPAIKVKSN